MSEPSIELRPDESGVFDELIATGADVHFEMMDDNAIWVSIEAGGKRYAVWISARGKLSVNVEDESDPSNPDRREK